MAGNEAELQIPTEGTSHAMNPKRAKKEDDSDWLIALATHAKETQTDILNLADHLLETKQVQIILNFLVGSKFTELNLSNNRLTNGVAYLAPFFTKMKIKKLNVGSCHLTKEDLLQLAEVLNDSEITDLVLSRPKDGKFDSDEGHRFISLLQQSKLTALNLDYFYFFLESDITSLFQEFSKLPVTSLDFKRRCFNSSDCISLFAKLSHSSVTNLNLEGIKISDEAFQELCQRLRETKIKKLILRRNKLKDVHLSILVDGLVGSKVADLDIMVNGFSCFDPLFGRLKDTQITTLTLGCKWYHGIEYRGHNFLTSPNSLQCSSLVSLELRCCYLSDAAGAVLMENLRFSSVETLLVLFNFLDILTVRKFTENIKDINLTSLDISGNPLSHDAFLLLGQHLKQSRLTCLKVGSLGYHLDDPIGPRIEVTHLLSFLKLTEGSSVCQIDMSHYLGSTWEHPPLFEPKLLVNTTFTELNLISCQIKDSVSNIIPFLKFSAITLLNLANNSITGNGAAVIAECLKETQIRRLELRNNLIGDEGAQSLALSLKFSAVTHLNLSDNRITDNGATVIAGCLKETQIRRLDLHTNLITDEGAKSLALSLKESNLVSLNLAGNQIKDDGFKSLAEHAKDMFISVLDVTSDEKDIVLYFNQLLWQNNVTIQKLVSIYKEIAPETNETEFKFDQNSDDFDVSAFLEKCFWFHATIVNNPRAINVLLEEKSVSFSRDQIFKLVLEIFPTQLSGFIACRIEADLSERVRILERAEELGLSAIVESLLIHRPIFMFDEEQGILHPHVYKLLIKYKQPICNLAVEPCGITKIIDYFTEHVNLEGAQDVVNLLCGSNIS